MPVEHLSVTLKPQSFFKVNPSMDVPASHDPHSKPAFPKEGGDNISAHGNGYAPHDEKEYANGHANGYGNGHAGNGEAVGNGHAAGGCC